MFESIQATSQATKLGILFATAFTVVLIFISQSGSKENLNKLDSLTSIADKLASPENMPGFRKVGGLGEVREKDDTVVEVVAKIKPILEEKTGKKYSSLEVINYKTQVVAGTNYFVKVDAKEEQSGKDSIMHLRIYRDLQQNLELTAYQADKTREDELLHFEP